MVNVKYHAKCLSSKLNPVLSKLWIEVSDLCNSRCVTCDAWKKTRTENTLNLKHLLRSSLFRNVDYIINSGNGEPSLADLNTILLTEHFLLPNATLQVSTNGLLPDKVYSAVVNALNAGAKVDVGISIDGVGPEHDKVRGVKGNFEKIDRLLTLFTHLNYPNLKLTLGSTLTDQTAMHGPAMVHYASKFNVPFMWHWANQSTFYGDATPAVSKENAVKALSYIPDGVYKQMWLRSLDGVKPSFKCSALKTFAVIRCNGEVVPCLTHWNQTIGNITDLDPLQVWNREQADRQRKFISSCKGCLNSWGCGWSLQQEYFPLLQYAIQQRLKHYV